MCVVELFRAAKVPVDWETYLVKGEFIELDDYMAETYSSKTKKDEGTHVRERLV